MTIENRYFFDKDDSGHGYLVPLVMELLWNEWCNEWERFDPHENPEAEPDLEAPEGCIRLNMHIANYSFTLVNVGHTLEFDEDKEPV